jgi:hypothetical protein
VYAGLPSFASSGVFTQSSVSSTAPSIRATFSGKPSSATRRSALSTGRGARPTSDHAS